MDLEAKKLFLIEWLLRVQDVQILNKVERIVNESPDFWENLPDEVKQSLKQSMEEYRAGKILTSQEVKERIRKKYGIS